MIGPARPVEVEMDAPDTAQREYADQFRARVEADPDIKIYGPPDREFLCRPNQLLVAVEERDRVARLLADLQPGQPAPPKDDPERWAQFERNSGTAVLAWSARGDGADVPAVLERLRQAAREAGEPPPAVLPHLVFTGTGNVMGHPARPPVAARRPPPPPAGARSGAVTVGVCDTGIWKEAAVEHLDWLGAFVQDPDDLDDLLVPGGVQLDLQAGHGTFVAGVLRQAAPGATFDPSRALSPLGVGDLVSVVGALFRLTPDAAVVNLSLGCYTEDDRAPAPLARALSRLGRDVVVVAAAGNHGENRPTWPAGFKRVVAVAAVQDEGQQLRPAPFSNWGPWVDACAVGLRTSTYVKGTSFSGDVFDGWAAWEGTSFAAPHVAGVIADDVRPGEGNNAWAAARRLLDQDPWHPDYGVLVR